MNYSAKNMALHEVCEVQVGYTARSRLEPARDGGVPAIQLRDLRGEQQADLSSLPVYPLGPSFERYWAGAGDILFRSRGERNTAVPIPPDAKGAAVAILPLIVLRPKRDLVDPAYLAWFINQKPAQQHFDKCAHSGPMRMIPKNCIDDLEVLLPSLEAQRLIVEIAALARREHALTQQLADKKLELTEFALHQQMRNAQPHGNGTGRIGARRQAGKSERTD
jgi:hypothetical protein